MVREVNNEEGVSIFYRVMFSYLKRIKIISVLLFVLFNTPVLFAQEEGNKGLVKGVVKEKSTQANIEFATVSLFRTHDSTLVTGGITSDLGSFEISKVPNGIYYVKVDFIGYESTYFNNITISNEVSEIDLGIINLVSFSKNMSQFEFVDEKELMETKIDKKVYNVSKDISVQGGTGLDVVKNMPSVEVDEQENISLRGDKGVQILIDGRPTTISAAQLLKQIPASSIERIEVITNPSAKYNPEGMSGILNIITKKEKASGFNGSVNIGYQYNQNSGYNGALNFTYRKNKISINSNIGTYRGFWSSEGKEDRRYFADTTYSQQMLSSGLGDNVNLWYSLGFDYYVNKKNTVYVQANRWGWSGNNNSIRRFNYLNEENVMQSFSNRNSISDNNNSGYGLTTGWQTQFDTEEHTLDLEINIYRDIEEGVNKNQQTYFFMNQNNQEQNTTNDGIGESFDAKVDYVLPITDSLQLESGVRTTINTNDNDFFSESSINNGILISDVNLNNTFYYQQNVYAAYAILAKQYKKIGIKLGNRIEQTTVNTELVNTKEKHTQDYLSWFPSIHLSYKFTEKSEVLLNYSRRINRPENWDVNPFASFNDPYRLYKGNPNLRPEYIDVYELSYLKFWDKFNLNSSAYFRQVNDKHQWITSIEADNVFVTSPQNLSKTQITGGEVTLGYNPKKWWKMNGTLNIWSSNLNNPTSNLNQNTYGWTTNFSSNFTLPKKWSLNTRVRYSGKQRSIQGMNLSNYNVSLSVSKELMKEKARITLRFDDIFWTQRWAFESNNLNGFSYYSNSQWSSRSVNISFSYNFGKMNYDSQKRQSKDNSAGDDLKIGGGEGGK
jgi:outer membrane receptor protein involved in Fe transport